MNKFGDELGEKVWNAVNECFDVMPMAATVDGKVSTQHVICRNASMMSGVFHLHTVQFVL